nr:minor coat protein [Agapanthus velarivirus]
MKVTFDLGTNPTVTIPIGKYPSEKILNCSPLKQYSVKVGGDNGYLKIIVTFNELDGFVNFEAKLYGVVYHGFDATLPNYTATKHDSKEVKLESKFEHIELLYKSRYYSVMVGGKQIYRTWDVCYSYETTYQCEYEYDATVGEMLAALRSPRDILNLRTVVPDKLLSFAAARFEDNLNRVHLIKADRWGVNNINNERARKALDKPKQNPNTANFDADVVRAYLVNKIERKSNIVVSFTELYRTEKGINVVVQFWFHRIDGYDELVFSFQNSDGTHRLLVEVWEVNNGVHQHKYDVSNVKINKSTEVFLIMLKNMMTYIVLDGVATKFDDFVGRQYEYETFGYEIQLVGRPSKISGKYLVNFPRWPKEVFLIGDVELTYSSAVTSPRQIGYDQCGSIQLASEQAVAKEDVLIKQSGATVVVGVPEEKVEKPPEVKNVQKPEQPPPGKTTTVQEDKPSLSESESECLKKVANALSMTLEEAIDFTLASSVLWGTSVEALHNNNAKMGIRVGTSTKFVDHALVTKIFFDKDPKRNLLRELCRKHSGYTARNIQNGIYDVNMQLVSKYSLLREFSYLAFDFLNMRYFHTATQDELMESNKITNYKYIRVSKIVNYDKY